MLAFMVQTQLCHVGWYDPKRRKPRLRIEILRLIGSIGKLSVHGAESNLRAKHHHREIWESFHALLKKGLISKMDLRTFDEGRTQKYYQLTKNGFFALIQEGMSPQDFWRATINFCRYTKQIDLNTIDLFYQEFLGGYLEYPSVIDNSYFISQLVIFDNMCEKWVQDNIKENEISLLQKILEILAFHPNLTLGQISEEADDSLKNVKLELKRITRDTTFQDGGFLTEYDEYIATNSLDYMSDFMLHNTIKIMSCPNGESIFSLSLYGVMLVIFLLRNHNAHRVVKDLFEFKRFNIQQSLDIISDNNKDLLPLIFGEWNLLKSMLRIASVYNFDIIVDKEARLNTLESPVLLKGNKEFYDAIQGIAFYSRKQLMDFVDSGLCILFSFERELDKENRIDLIKAVRRKLTEINVVLGYSVGDETKWNTTESRGQSIVQLNNLSTVSILQRAFANEITFLYYINQCQDIYFPDLLPAPDYNYEFNIPSLKEEAETFWLRKYDKYSLAPQKGHFLPTSPKQRLLDILTGSNQIKESFVNCIDDCIRYYNRARDVMNNLSIELSRQ
jgi:hypothetical protein